MSTDKFNQDILQIKGFVEIESGVFKKLSNSNDILVKKNKKVSPIQSMKQIEAPKPTDTSIRINIKPLSVNQAWRGRRWKTPKYDKFEQEVLRILPEIVLPNPPYKIYLKFGFSSKASDWDNCIKQTVDCLAKRYNFNDKLIRKGIVETEIVPKKEEYFIFLIESL